MGFGCGISSYPGVPVDGNNAWSKRISAGRDGPSSGSQPTWKEGASVVLRWAGSVMWNRFAWSGGRPARHLANS